MSAPFRARLGPLVEQQLVEGCRSNASAALRAYLLLGMAATGISMQPFQRDIRRALAEDLAPAIERALRQLLDGSDRPGVLEQRFVVSSGASLDEADDGDPMLRVGMDF